MATKNETKTTAATDPRDPRNEAGGNLPAVREAEALAVPAKNAGVRKATAADTARLMTAYEAAPMFVTLESGDLVEGAWVRWGTSTVNDVDRLTGSTIEKKVRTCVIDLGTHKIEFLTAHELNRQLDGITAGEPVWVMRGDDERAGKNVVTRYQTGRGKAPASPAATR